MDAVTTQAPIKYMQCMEVWGGNHPVDSGVIMPGLDAWVYSQPCHEESAGGDVHYLSTCCGGAVVRMVVADIAGHGPPVAGMAVQLRKIVRRFINTPQQLSVVRLLNREFTAASSRGIFATAVVLTFNSTKNTLMVTNAGHPPPLWYQTRQRRWTLLQPAAAASDGDLPWGIEDESSYQQFEAALQVGDIVLCYTDALAESKGTDGELLGPGGLVKVANGLSRFNPPTLIPTLLAEIGRCDPAYAARDDVTCLAIRPNGLRPKIPLRDMALAPLRWAASNFGLKFGYSGWKRQAAVAEEILAP